MTRPLAPFRGHVTGIMSPHPGLKGLLEPTAPPGLRPTALRAQWKPSSAPPTLVPHRLTATGPLSTGHHGRHAGPPPLHPRAGHMVSATRGGRHPPPLYRHRTTIPLPRRYGGLPGVSLANRPSVLGSTGRTVPSQRNAAGRPHSSTTTTQCQAPRRQPHPPFPPLPDDSPLHGNPRGGVT